jgi:hypothetical protein
MMTTGTDGPPLGKLVVDDELTVTLSDGRRVNTVRVRVAKVGRVWIDVEPLDDSFLPHYALRYRMDNQQSESGKGRFYTDEQWVWRKRVTDAKTYLAEIGVQADWNSPYRHNPLALANAIRRGLGESEL